VKTVEKPWLIIQNLAFMNREYNGFSHSRTDVSVLVGCVENEWDSSAIEFF